MNILKFAKVAAVGVAALFAVPASAATIDLGFSLDGSGSVGNANFNLTRDALADALASIPTSGDNVYRIAITQFGSDIGTIVPPTRITSAADLTAVQTSLRAASRISGTTNTAGALLNLRDLFVNDGGFGDTTLFNITTDGAPNSQSAAIDAANAIIASGVDGLSFEAISATNSQLNALLELARPFDPDATVITDLANIPNATQTGFVIEVANFGDYEAAIQAKIGRIITDTSGGPSPVPLPAGLPLLLTGLAGFAALRRTRRKAAA